MGWGSGSDIMSNIIYGMKRKVKNEVTRLKAYKIIIDAFFDHDWDTEEDVMGMDKVFDEALKEVVQGKW